MEILDVLEMKISLCRQNYETYRNSSFLSNVYAAELEQLKEFRDKLQAGESPEIMLQSLQQLLPELKAYREQEAVSPSFDWYGEHYQYEQLEGVCSAFETMISLLEQI